MNKEEIDDGFRLLGLDNKIDETYEDISEFTYKLINDENSDKKQDFFVSNTTECKNA